VRKLAVLAVAAAGVYVWSAAPQAAAVRAVTADAIRGSVHGGTLGCAGLERLWISEGGSRSAAFTAAEIAMAESSGQQYATMHNTNGTTDRGYFQINSIWGALSTYDAAGNARAAIRISHDGTDWSPWVTYDRNLYQGKC
jgi:hypothetical protein